MGKTVKIKESELRRMVLAELKRTAAKSRINEVNVRSTDELADGDYERMCGVLKGKIETLYMWKDDCKTLEELQRLIGRLFDDIID